MGVMMHGEVKRETPKAILWEDSLNPENPFWIPRSCCHNGDSIDVGDTEVEVRTWWHDQNGYQRWPDKPKPAPMEDMR